MSRKQAGLGTCSIFQGLFLRTSSLSLVMLNRTLDVCGYKYWACNYVMDYLVVVVSLIGSMLF